MKKQLKYMLMAIGEHFLYIVMSFVLMFILGSLLRKFLWAVSIITALVYLSAVYSSGWSNSGKDFRAAKAKAKERGSEEITDYKIYSGFIYAIPLLVISIILLVLDNIFGSYFTVIFRIYNFSFVYFLDIKAIPDTIVEIIITVLPFIFYGLGYIAGKDKKVFISKHLYKLIYKSAKNEEKLRK